MIRFRHFFLGCLMMAATAAVFPTDISAAAKAPVWEVVETRDPEVGSAADDIEVVTRDNYIFITTPQPVEARVYTILGQLITTKKIAAGTVRLSLGLRGVYILKADTKTFRINL